MVGIAVSSVIPACRNGGRDGRRLALSGEATGEPLEMQRLMMLLRGRVLILSEPGTGRGDAGSWPGEFMRGSFGLRLLFAHTSLAK